ncbi:MAG: type IV pilus twitching motility protein PilT [Candidatus Latescibacteria bacterium]|nr:type IV pilus twitching motility protein PilT [Candidatus Latescibacterota bacterium]
MAQIDKLFHLLKERKGSDLHISVGAPPLLRISGDLTPVTNNILPQNETKKLLYEIMTPFQQQRFEENLETDFAYAVEGIARFRANVFMQHRGIAAVFRLIPEEILSVEQLSLPKQIINFAKLYKGLVLCTGPTGSGKSTTLAALIDYVNSTRSEHIITIEDPIEFVHNNKKCLVNQRELGAHTESFSAALRSALREDPDVILVGEMRDLETIQLAMTAAETGHLVFGTLHTSSAAKTIDRIIDVFPSAQQGQVRSMLSESLMGVMAQTLLKKTGGGRIAAIEILVGSPAISNLIRENKTYQIPSVLQTSKSEGMQTLDMALLDLYQKRRISANDCIDRASDKKVMRAALG